MGEGASPFRVGTTSLVPLYRSDHIPHLLWERWSTPRMWQWLDGGDGPQGWHMGEAGCCSGGLFAVISPSKAKTSPKHTPRGGLPRSEERTSTQPAAKRFPSHFNQGWGINLYNVDGGLRASQGPRAQGWQGGKPQGGDGGC